MISDNGRKDVSGSTQLAQSTLPAVTKAGRNQVAGDDATSLSRSSVRRTPLHATVLRARQQVHTPHAVSANEPQAKLPRTPEHVSGLQQPPMTTSLHGKTLLYGLPVLPNRNSSPLEVASPFLSCVAASMPSLDGSPTPTSLAQTGLSTGRPDGSPVFSSFWMDTPCTSLLMTSENEVQSRNTDSSSISQGVGSPTNAQPQSTPTTAAAPVKPLTALVATAGTACFSNRMRAFLGDCLTDPQSPATVDAAAVASFSAEEKREAVELLARLQSVLEPPSRASTAASGADAKRASASLPTPKSSPLAATVPTAVLKEEMTVIATRKPSLAFGKTLTALEEGRESRLTSITHVPPPLLSTASSSAASALRRSCTARGSIRGLKRITPEDRYQRALQTVEEAADDCDVALQRVRHYSDSLKTLVTTWMDLHDNNFAAFAQAVVLRLLSDNPSYAVLFYTTDVPSQSLVIMDMIGRSVVAFTRPVDLMDIMAEIGARHTLYGLNEQHFLAMRDAFLDVYKEFVSPETFTSSVDVWRMFWKTTVELAASGAKSQRGVIYTERRNVVWSQRVLTFVKQLLPLQRSGGFHRLLHAMYEHAVARNPALVAFSEFGNVRTAHRCMEALLRIIKKVANGAGAAVVSYNATFSIQEEFPKATFTLDVMDELEPAFLHACSSFTSGTSLWNDMVKESMRELWRTYVKGYWVARPAVSNPATSVLQAPGEKASFCLMFTDVESSTQLWDADTRVMAVAMRNHHSIIRGLIEDFGGYEVKTVGDSFLIATQSVSQALLIAYGIQLELMSGPSAPEFEMVPSTQGKGEAACWRSDALRVRVGVHYCQDAAAVYDSVHGRFDYYGPGVNCAARVEAAACGGQVLLSEGAYMQLQEEDEYKTSPANRLYVEELTRFLEAQEARGVTVTDSNVTQLLNADAMLTDPVAMSSTHTKAGVLTKTMAALTCVEDIGSQMMKGIAAPVYLYSLLPVGLQGRRFPRVGRHRHESTANHSKNNASDGAASMATYDMTAMVMPVEDAFTASVGQDWSVTGLQSIVSSGKLPLASLSIDGETL